MQLKLLIVKFYLFSVRSATNILILFSSYVFLPYGIRINYRYYMMIVLENTRGEVIMF